MKTISRVKQQPTSLPGQLPLFGDCPIKKTGLTPTPECQAPTESSSMSDSTERPEKEQITPNPFAPESLRLSQDFVSTAGVKKVLTHVPCRKPHGQEFVRVRKGAEWQLDTWIFKDNIDGEMYVVAPTMVPAIVEEIRPAKLCLTINRQGDLFFWPINLPKSDGGHNLWNESSLTAANFAKEKWTRVTSNKSAGMYEVFEATGESPEPEWPLDMTMEELLTLAFKDRFISSLDHSMLKRLRGET